MNGKHQHTYSTKKGEIMVSNLDHLMKDMVIQDWEGTGMNHPVNNSYLNP